MRYTRHILALLLSCLTLTAQYHWPTYVYDNQMEEGDIWGFSASDRLGANSVIYATNDVVHSGAYSLYWRFYSESIDRQARAYYTLSESPNYATGQTHYCRFYFRIGSNTAIPASSSINLMTWYSTSGEERLFVYNNAGTWTLRSYNLSANGGTVTTNTWYCVESKFKPGTGDAQIQYWLDGTSVINSTTATLAAEPQSIRFGQHSYIGTDNNIWAECWMDDFRVSYAPIGALGTNVTLCVPDLRGRIGVPALAVLTDFTAGDRVVWKLGDSTATNAVLTNTVTTGAVRGRIPLLSLASGHHVLSAEYQTSGGTLKSSASHAWTNDYSGDPVVSIDKYNRFCVSNAPMFLLGNFVDQYDNSETLFASNIINVMTGGDWNERNVAGMSNVLVKMWNAGARTEVGYPFPSGSQLNTNVIAEYVTNLHSHPGVFSWFWEDEPEVTNYYTAAELNSFRNTAKAIDGRISSGLNLIGASLGVWTDANGNTFNTTESARENSLETNHRKGHQYTWPWLCADYYGSDVYPYYYTNQSSMATYTLAAKRGLTWNLGLTPSITFVQPYTLNDPRSSSNEDDTPPTTNQVQLMVWASVAAGCSGTRWFEYHESRYSWTNNAWANMQYVGQTLKAWEPAILADLREDITTAQEYREPPQAQLYTGPGIVFKSTAKQGTNYIFAVNLSRNHSNTTFNVPGLLSGTTVTKRLGGGTVTADSDSFTATLPYEGFEVYSFEDASPTNYHYIRAGASGTGGGTNWTDALTDLPATFVRGHRYYVADGTYGSHTFNSLAGTDPVEIVKATASNHGTGTGWDAAYGDGQAVFTNSATVFTVAMQYLTIDGATGSGKTGHGIKLASATKTDGQGAIVVAYGTSATGLTVKHCELHAAPWGDSNGARVVSISTATTTNLTFQYCYLHGGRVWIGSGNADDVLIEHCYGEDCGSDDGALHSAGLVLANCDRITVRYNVFKNMLGGANTTYIEPQQNGTGYCTDFYIYGNTFIADNAEEATSQGIFAITSNDDVRNVHIYNNTIYGVGANQNGGVHSGIWDGSKIEGEETYGNQVVASNNLFYATGAAPGFYLTAHNYNASEYDLGEANDQLLSGDPFTSASTGDFTLTTNTVAGVNLGAPYNYDPLGTLRSTWTRGAFEYGSAGGGGTDPDTTPPNISSVSAAPSTTAATVTWTTDEAATSGLEWGLTTSYTGSSTNASLVSSHSLSASGLSAGTLYHYRVISSDSSGNTTVGSDGTFTTDAEAPVGGGTTLSVTNLTAGKMRKQ